VVCTYNGGTQGPKLEEGIIDWSHLHELALSPKKLVFRYWVNDCGRVVLLQLAKRSVELPACKDNLIG